MIIPEYVLIVANSGRMLSQAAKRAGYTPFVIDLYADKDTRSAAKACNKIASLALADLIPVVETLLLQYPITQVIYGSGFEEHSDSLLYLAERFTMSGNRPGVFKKLLNKPDFFAMLHTLSIPHPAISFTEPHNTGQHWLVKPLQGQGGVGISHYRQGNCYPASVYWQQHLEGTCYSALYLADGKHMQVVGFNKQWPTRIGDQDFIFSGITNDCDVPAKHKAQIAVWLQTLICVYAIKGLNSIDFICNDHGCFVLEINARPPASMQLYDDSLFVRHIAASQGRLLENTLPFPLYKSYQILYAEHDTYIPEGFQWPYWCCDLPEDGAIIHTGQPICSIIASHRLSRQVMQQLVIRRQMIIGQLDKVFTHGIQSER